MSKWNNVNDGRIHWCTLVFPLPYLDGCWSNILASWWFLLQRIMLQRVWVWISACLWLGVVFEQWNSGSSQHPGLFWNWHQWKLAPLAHHNLKEQRQPCVDCILLETLPINFCLGHHQYKFPWEAHKWEVDNERLCPGDQTLKQKNAKNTELLLVILSRTQMNIYFNTLRSWESLLN